jgi:hypothetical protein
MAAPEPKVTDGTSRQSGPGPYQDAERRGRRIAERLQTQALYERGAELSPAELATALEQATSLPAEVIARLARARNEEHVAEGAERARAADLRHASAAQSGRERSRDLTAARRDTQVADTVGVQVSAGRTAAQLAAENFPHTAADGIRAAIAGRLQQPEGSLARTSAVTGTRRVGLAHEITGPEDAMCYVFSFIRECRHSRRTAVAGVPADECFHHAHPGAGMLAMAASSGTGGTPAAVMHGGGEAACGAQAADLNTC